MDKMCCQSVVEFDVQVDRWVMSVLRGREVTFAQLVHALPGVYPSTVRASLMRLAATGAVGQKLLERMLIESTNCSPLLGSAVNAATSPVPHPLDFEWRYTSEAVNRLLRDLDGVSGPLLLLGTPSVAGNAALQHPTRKVVVLDSNAVALAHLRNTYPRIETELCDIVRDELPLVVPGARVIIDPPWYPEFFEIFFWAACRLSRPDASVFVSLPPLGTRPGMQEERAQLFSFAKRMGLELVNLDEGVLPYLTPLFEYNALRAEGITGVPLNWRRGDLAEFVRNGTSPGPRPLAPPPDGGWREVMISGVRIRIRERAAFGFEDPCLVPLVSGDILSSVSRRDPRRARVDVWTSGNRVFACQGPALFAHVLRALLVGQSPVALLTSALGRPLTSQEAAIVDRASGQAGNLVQTEQREQVLWDEQRRHEGLAPVSV